MIFNLFRKKPKQPIKVKRITCSKHGVVSNFAIHIVGGKNYDVCWDCMGEFGSQYVTTEEVEVRGEK